MLAAVFDLGKRGGARGKRGGRGRVGGGGRFGVRLLQPIERRRERAAAASSADRISAGRDAYVAARRTAAICLSVSSTALVSLYCASEIRDRRAHARVEADHHRRHVARPLARSLT